jgi:GNAT superfamily N-acetyltransferase
MTMSGAPDAVRPEAIDGEHWRIEADTVIVANANTTIGYARFSRDAASLDYIFVNPAFRRRGYGRRLVAFAEHASGAALTPAQPLSPLGRKLFADGPVDGGCMRWTAAAPKALPE